jgi:hypothetical protein
MIAGDAFCFLRRGGALPGLNFCHPAFSNHQYARNITFVRPAGVFAWHGAESS